MTARRAALGGAALWSVLAAAAAVGAVRLSLIDVLLLLAPLVVVPLGMDLLPIQPPGRLLRAARVLQPLGAVAVAASLLLPAGTIAGALSGIWLAPCALVGFAGAHLLVTRRSIVPEVTAPAAAMGFLAIGGSWLFMSRTGLRPGGFSADIVELTAVHFHFAGFAATLMAGLTVARVSDRGTPRVFAAVGSYLMVLGTPVVATGIALDLKPVAFAGAALLATGVLTIAAVTILAVVPAVPPRARIPLATSAIAVFLPMVLAVLYTARPVVGSPALGLHDMAATHGVLNSLAFSVLGLIGWHLAGSAADQPPRVTGHAPA